ncbi:MAG: anti-sigma factor antagonist, partial [Mycobacterium sp.]|nr:anti-sigma factor antagonist [Mycobacterium sp.]
AEKAIVIVLSPDSLMYRVAELMCMPVHDDAEAARRVLQDGAS